MTETALEPIPGMTADELRPFMQPSPKSVIARTEDAVREGAWETASTLLKQFVNIPEQEGGYTPAQYHHILGDCAMGLGFHSKAVTYYTEALRLDPTLRTARENLVFLVDAQPWTTQADAQRERERWWTSFGAPAYAQRKPHRNVVDPEKRLRVAYVSADYRFHSAQIACTAVISNHSDQIEPVFYSTLPEAMYDHVTKRDWIQRYGHSFVDVSRLTPECFAEVIQNDGIDILVDLSGWTAGNKLQSFAYKPAPIQITAWGYATGVGNPSMDVLFADAIVATPEMRARLHERVIDLPCVIGFNPRPDLPPPNPLPCLEAGPVFGVFQRAMKVNEDALSVWASILRKVPESSLMFKGPDYTPATREWIVQAMGPIGRQVSFEPGGSHLDHQHWYAYIDLSLDPWPQTGGVSTMESCWMGVPCVTLMGERVIQRTSASILTTLGLPELVTTTRKAYIQTAVEMVTTKRDWLNDVRLGLRDRMQRSPILNGYRDVVEGHYRQLWRAWCATQEGTPQ